MIIDLSHPIYDGMPAYPGLPPARVLQLVSHEESRPRYEGRAEFALSKLDIATNTGTYLDSPWHRHAGSGDIGAISLERVANLAGVVVDAAATQDREGVEAAFDPTAVKGGALLIRTGWSSRWGTESYWSDGPFVSRGMVDRIVAAEPALVGIDCANVDDTSDPARPAHTRLLGAGILIVEHLTNLAGVPMAGFSFHCAPLRVDGAGSMPVRPYVVLDGPEQSP